MSQSIFCPNCGKGVASHAIFCTNCGNAVPKLSSVEAPTERDLSSPPQTNFRPPHRWMDGQQESPRPVTPLTPNPPPYQPPVAQSKLFPCPDCGRMISRTAAFCPQCGSNMQAFHAHQTGFQATTPAPSRSFSQRSSGEQLLIILLAIIAACIILGFFC